MSEAAARPLRLLYCAWLREQVGRTEEYVSLPENVATVGELTAWLGARSPGFAAAAATGRSVRCAVNQTFADPSTPVCAGDEVAFFPPVTGG